MGLIWLCQADIFIVHKANLHSTPPKIIIFLCGGIKSKYIQPFTHLNGVVFFKKMQLISALNIKAQGDHVFVILLLQKALDHHQLVTMRNDSEAPTLHPAETQKKTKIQVGSTYLSSFHVTLPSENSFIDPHFAIISCEIISNYKMPQLARL